METSEGWVGYAGDLRLHGAQGHQTQTFIEEMRELQAVDRKIEAEEQRKAVLQAWFKSMLHQLMTGQVRLRDVGFEG